MRIAGLWRYPVKGLLGETVEAATFDDRGMTGDRNWAVVGLDGKLGSGKTTRRFRRMPNLFTMSARTHDREVLVTVNGWEGSVTDPTTAARVSEVIGERVTLEPERVVPHHDEGGVHVVTTTSLRLIDGVDVRRLRPNVLIDCSGEGPIEDSWIGMHLRMGSVDLRVVQRMPRCVMTTLAQFELPFAPGILSTIENRNGGSLGVVAEVSHPGKVAIRQPVRALASS